MERKASIEDAFHVHKIENEYRKEVGMPLLVESDYMAWTKLLFDETREYRMFKHGKKFIGMIWGHTDGFGVFVVEGRYLKPQFRTMKFKREMARAWVSFRNRFDTIRLRAQPFKKTRHKPVFVEVMLLNHKKGTGK